MKFFAKSPPKQSRIYKKLQFFPPDVYLGPNNMKLNTFFVFSMVVPYSGIHELYKNDK